MNDDQKSERITQAEIEAAAKVLHPNFENWTVTVPVRRGTGHGHVQFEDLIDRATDGTDRDGSQYEELVSDMVARIRELEAERYEWKQCAEVEAGVRREFKEMAEKAEAATIERCKQAITALMNESSDACWNDALNCADEAIDALKPSD